MSAGSNLKKTITVDPPVDLPPGYSLDRADRRYIDDQVQAIQQHLVSNLLRGIVATWMHLDSDSQDGVSGDIVCASPATAIGDTVTRATSGGLTASGGKPFGMLLQAAKAGAMCLVAMGGIVPQTVHGLSPGTAGYVRLNGTTARGEYVASLSAGDVQVGSIDASGNITVGGSGSAGGTSINGAAGIGTTASPGILRGLIGSSSLTALHVGGFWSLQDSGGGSFYWDGASTATDDSGTIIRPSAAGVGPSDPGRWKRIWSGALQIDWFGAHGDGLHDASTTGTDDNAALQAAITFAGTYGHRLLLDPRKVYISGSPTLSSNASLNLSYQGLVLDGQGAWNFQHGAWIKFLGAHDDVMVSINSTVGVQVRGLVLTGVNLTRTVLDLAHTHANQAARLAAGWTVLGTTVDQTDTGQRWRLAALPSSSASNWVLASYAMISTRQANWGGIGGTGGSDSIGLLIENCLISGPVSYAMQQGIQVAQTDCSKIVNCNLSYFVYGVTSNDQYWGGGAGICIDVDTCNFNAIQTRSIFQPFSNWTIRNNSFEVRADGSLDGVEVSTSVGGNSSNIVCIGNIHADSTVAGGSCYRFTSCFGVTLIGNQGFTTAGGTFCYLSACIGVESHGNTLFGLTKSYDIDNVNPTPCAAMKLGPDLTNLAPSGTNYRNSLALTMNNALTAGGMSWGGNNTFTSFNCAAIGSSNVAGPSSMAVGSGNTSSTGGFVSGLNGIGLDWGDVVHGGGTNTGIVGGSQTRKNVLSSNAITGGGAVTSLLKPDGLAVITLTDNRLYSLVYRTVVGKNNLTTAFHTERRALIRRVTSGTVSLISDVETWKDDPGATLISVAAVMSSGNLDIKVTNPTANVMYGECYFWLHATYSP